MISRLEESGRPTTVKPRVVDEISIVHDALLADLLKKTGKS